MLGVGVIGAGVMGAEHARILREETGGARLVAVSDPDESRSNAAAKGAKIFTDAHSLINDPEVAAVVIAAPDIAHAELTIACIAAGKPVLCEKPLAPTASEALTVVQAELTAGRHLVTTGYMRRFDPAYLQMRNALDSGEIGDAAILHNIHRNKSAPDWFTGPMSITNSFVHEIDISRFLLRGEMVSAHVTPAPGGDPLLITMQSTDGVIVSTEVHVNAGYGYHVHAQLVGRSGTIEMAAPTEVLTNRAGQGGYGYPDDWVPRFADAYRRQMQAWVGSCASEQVVGASAWDGYIATLIAEIIVEALQEREAKELNLPARPAFYD